MRTFFWNIVAWELIFYCVKSIWKFSSNLFSQSTLGSGWSLIVAAILHYGCGDEGRWIQLVVTDAAYPITLDRRIFQGWRVGSDYGYTVKKTSIVANPRTLTKNAMHCRHHVPALENCGRRILYAKILYWNPRARWNVQNCNNLGGLRKKEKYMDNLEIL